MSSLNIRNSVIEHVNTSVFEKNIPIPWCSFDRLLSDNSFQELIKTFPSLDYFERHSGLPRSHGQRPHDRWYLALEHSIYDHKEPGMKGCIALNDLDPCWQDFINELKESDSYNKMIEDLLGVKPHSVRFAWHIASTGGDISPHIDDPLKAGTHIFYFNTNDDWKEEWGGQTLFLGDIKHEKLNPEISDFDFVVGAPMINNKSMLFKNTVNAWHGVAPIDCGNDHYRRLFNVIFQLPERPTHSQNIIKRLGRRLKRIIN